MSSSVQATGTVIRRSCFHSHSECDDHGAEHTGCCGDGLWTVVGCGLAGGGRCAPGQASGNGRRHQYVEESSADLVVVGTRGRTGMRAILLGTVAERIVRESPCSVLAVKPDDFKYEID